MANITKSLFMPNGQEYEFVGKHWFGTCNTSAYTQHKTVSITGFTSADLVEGTQVTIQFSYAQLYTGTPYLNVSSTGAKSINSRNGSFAEGQEWGAGDFITFVLYSNSWFIIDGEHATTGFWGKTKLSNFSHDNDTLAATPRCVLSAAREIIECQYLGFEDSSYIKLLDSTTPTSSEWTYDNQRGWYYYTFNNIPSFTGVNSSGNRILKIKYGDLVKYNRLTYQYTFSDTIDAFLYGEYVEGTWTQLSADWDFVNNTFTVYTSFTNSYLGENPIKVEFFIYGDAGFITYPLLKDTLSNYLTLDTLPIWDGGVV